MSHNQPPPGPYGTPPGTPPGPPPGPPSQGGPNPYGQGAPGPYGQGAPGPYAQGAPGPYAQGGAPYAAPQPPQPGYGYPQQPQMPPGYPPGMPPAPPGGGGKGKTTGLVIGAVVVVAAIVGGVLLFRGASDDELTDDGKDYRLTVPSTVLGEYTSDSGDSTSQRLDGEAARDFGLTKGMGLEVEWATPGDAKKIQMLGAYGTVPDPEKSVDSFFSKLKKKSETAGSEDSDVVVVGSPERKSPAGFENGVMKCQIIRPKEEPSPDEPSSLALCVWADYDTVALVIPREGARDLTLDESAQTAANLRKEVRVEVPK
ncbi:hypothetical protein [Streptomyces cuspidosporus]|uniref:hypothetical protein n=1 Tax=Streptomyces cuspidosporus TaxID=66882 RepID=UPI0031FBEB00